MGKTTESTALPQKSLLRSLIGFAIYLLLGPLVLFASAGTIKWPLAWVYSLTTIVLTIISRIFLIRKFPDLAQERANHRNVEGVKAWDRALGALVGLFGNLAILLVAGLDTRFGWSPDPPSPIAWLAMFTGIGIGYLLGSWAMLENRFFSAVVRIQKERGHTVCTTGPYKVIRHPGYAGALLFYLTTPLMLSALWAFIPAGLTVALLVLRTALEDKILQEELAGYSDYAKETQYKLIPGIW